VSAIGSSDPQWQQTSWLPPEAREVRVRLVLHGPTSSIQVLVETWEADELVAYGTVPVEALTVAAALQHAIGLMTDEVERQIAQLSPF
jgi:hypothetical protein